MATPIHHALHWQYSDKRIEVRVFRLDELYTSAVACLPTETLAHLRSCYKSPRRQREKIAAAYLLPYLLPTGSSLAYTAAGRPYLIGSTRHISLTHNEVYLAIALATSPVGLDIEQESQQLMRVSPRFFSAEEIALARTATLPLAVLWSAKEAIYKCLGRAGLSPLQDIRLGQAQWRDTSTLSLCARVADVPHTLSISSHSIGHDTYMSWCLL